MPARFCKSFQPPSCAKQVAAIGLDVRDKSLSDAMRCCLDPSCGDWEDLEPPEEHEWLEDLEPPEEHECLEAMLDKTPDQSFRDFVISRPNLPEKSRQTIFLQPLAEQQELDGPAYPAGTWPSWSALEAAVQRFYAPMKVQTLPAVPMESLQPAPERRVNAYGPQYNAATILDALARKTKANAYGTLAVTMCDLYPKPEWNFVYGLARLTGRVGVFSFARHVPPERGAPSPEWREAQLLHRAMKTMLHEIGHMFGLKHCTFFNCLMRGSNGEGVEHQINYLHLCPVCLRKLHWSIGFDVAAQYASLLEIFLPYEKVSQLFRKDCDFLRRRLAALRAFPDAATAAPPSWAAAPRSRSCVAARPAARLRPRAAEVA